MTDKDLLKVIGRIDDWFIEEAAESASAPQRVRRRRARRTALLAACLAVLLVSGNVPLQYAQAAKEYFR